MHARPNKKKLIFICDFMWFLCQVSLPVVSNAQRRLANVYLSVTKLGCDKKVKIPYNQSTFNKMQPVIV